MIYLLLGAAFVAWVAMAIFVVNLLLDGDNFWSFAPAAIFFAVSVAGVLYLADQHENKAPCVQYEQRMMYNAATKTMMPARVCVERGEWVE